MSVPILLQTEPAQVEQSTRAARSRNWPWKQTWRDVFFAHWQVPAETLGAHLPRSMEVDTWEGTGWVSVVAFRLDVRLRWLPSFGLTSNFVEVNLRTYVRCNDEPGIYFLSIHAGSRIAVALARMLTPLPYVYAPLNYSKGAEYWRLNDNALAAVDTPSLLDATVRPAGNAMDLETGSLDAWLLERYTAFVVGHRGRTLKMRAEHAPWMAQSATAMFRVNQLGRRFGLDLDLPPDAIHFAPFMAARLGQFENV